MDPTAHQVAHELVRQLAADPSIREAAAELYGFAPRFYLDDDDADDDAPHVVAAPESTGDDGGDGEIAVRLTVSARDIEGEGAGTEIDPASDAEANIVPAAIRFDRFAHVVWRAVPDTRPGAILAGRSAEWDFASFHPLRFAVFTLSYRLIHSFGDK